MELAHKKTNKQKLAQWICSRPETMSQLPRIVSFEQLFEFVSSLELDVSFSILTMLCSRKHEIVKWVLRYESMTYCTWETLYPLAKLCRIVALLLLSSLSERPLSSLGIDLAATEADLELFLRACPAVSHIDSATMEVDLGLVLRTCSAEVAWILLQLEAELWYFNFKFWCKISLCDWVNWGVRWCLLSSWR